MKKLRLMLGVIALLLGFWGANVHYVPSNTLRFNLLYVLNGQEALIIVGLELILIRLHIHKAKDKP